MPRPASVVGPPVDCRYAAGNERTFDGLLRGTHPTGISNLALRAVQVLANHSVRWPEVGGVGGLSSFHICSASRCRWRTTARCKAKQDSTMIGQWLVMAALYQLDPNIWSIVPMKALYGTNRELTSCLLCAMVGVGAGRQLGWEQVGGGHRARTLRG